MKVAISVPDDVFEDGERAAKKLGVSRSELYARALREFLGARRSQEITRSYDRAFGGDEPGDASLPREGFRREAARRALEAVEWSDE